MARHKKGGKSRGRGPRTESAGSTEDRDDRQPYRVETSDVIGRYLVAKKGLKAGEVVMVDEAIVVGPCQESKPVCIGCYADLNLDDESSYRRCAECAWPLCSESCPGAGKRLGHSGEECAALSKSSIGKARASELRTCFYAIAPMRLLLVKASDPEMWKIVRSMETHTEERKKNRSLWKLNEELAVETIRKVFGLTEFTPEEIHFACGALEVNAFEATPSATSQPLRAIYPNAFLFAHDCVPNTSHSNGEDFSIVVKTIRPVAASSSLTVSYTYTLQSTVKRRQHLMSTKFFACSCDRCRDATEFGVYCSALKCPRCKSGAVLPKDPLDEASPWKCASPKCGVYEVEASVVNAATQRLSDELDAIDGNDVQGYEDFLRRHGDTLHDNHYLSLSALHCLFQLYGKVKGYLIHDLPDEMLDRKVEICRQLLRAFDKLEPGLSKQRGVLLYELHAPLMVMLQRRFDRRNIAKKDVRQKMREINKCLEESYAILRTEWEGSSEGQIAAAAKEALSNTKNWESILNFL